MEINTKYNTDQEVFYLAYDGKTPMICKTKVRRISVDVPSVGPKSIRYEIKDHGSSGNNVSWVSEDTLHETEKPIIDKIMKGIQKIDLTKN